MQQVTIKNEALSLSVINYGAIIQNLKLKSPNGEEVKLVVGHDNHEDYLKDPYSLGACIGRFAGRISKGVFSLNGRQYRLHAPDGVHLHGGKKGFGKKYWTVEEVLHTEQPSVKLSYRSPHLEEGYPGTLTAIVTYQLVHNALHIVHEANTDSSTVINLTNHTYFCPDDAPDPNGWLLRIAASERLETREDLVPTGRILPVEQFGYDFQKALPIGTTRLDTPFVLGPGFKEAAVLHSPLSGIRMRVFTDQQAMVVYTPKNFPGICFETQNFPDAPNQPGFPSSVLQPGETYRNTAVFEFDLVP